MKCSLAFVLDEKCECRVDLITSNSLLSLDKLVQEFNNGQEVRKKYQKEIDDFIYENFSYYQSLQKRKPNYQGQIQIVVTEYDNKIHRVPVLYKNGRKLDQILGCLTKIRETLEQDDKLKELLARKSYLLTEIEKECLIYYLNNPEHNEELRRMAIYQLNKEISNANPELQHFYLRSLMNLCGLDQTKIKIPKKGKVTIYNEEQMSMNSIIKSIKEPKSVRESIFEKMLKDREYEEIFKMFTKEELESFELYPRLIKERGDKNV